MRIRIIIFYCLLPLALFSQTTLPSRWAVFSDDFESGTLDKWQTHKARQLQIVDGSGYNISKGLKVDILEGQTNVIQTEYLLSEVKGTHVYLTFWFNPNSVDIPLDGSLESKSLRIAEILGDDWNEILGLKLFATAGNVYAGYLEWEDDAGIRQSMDTNDAFALSNGWQKITIGAEIDSWVAIWINDSFVYSVTSNVTHQSAYAHGKKIGQTGWPWNYSSGSYLFDNIELQIPAHDGTYYVTKNGHDANPGTEAQPWLTIQKAANMVTPGATVLIKQGTYNEKIDLGLGGADGRPVTFKAYPGDEGKVQIDGTGIDVENRGLFNIVGQSYVHMNGLSFVNSAAQGVLVTKYWRAEAEPGYLEFKNLTFNTMIESGLCVMYSNHVYADSNQAQDTGTQAALYFYMCDSVRISNNSTQNSASSGIGIWKCKNVIVDHNEIMNACDEIQADGGSYQECLTLSSTDSFQVKNNTVYYTDGSIGSAGGCGIDAKESCRNGHILKNHIYNVTESVGIYLDAWDAGLNDENGDPTPTHANLYVYQNKVHHCGTGISSASEAGGTSENIYIYNNIITDSRYCGIIISDWADDGPRQDMYIYNNTLYNSVGNGGAGIMVDTDNVIGLTIRNNVVDFGHNWIGQILLQTTASITADHNLVANYTQYPSDEAPNSIWAEPQFMDSLNYDLHLKPTSPGIDAGIAIVPVEADYDDQNRPLGAAYDLGAFEYKPIPRLICTALLQGVYDAAGDSLKTDLNPDLPMQSPYNSDPVNVITIPDSIVDWVKIEILDTSTGSILDSQSAFITATGRIVNPSILDATYWSLANGSYLIRVAHRNHLSITSAPGIPLSEETTSEFDFTSSLDQAAGTNSQIQLATNRWGLWCGDITQDGLITSKDYCRWYNSHFNSEHGYVDSDLNSDGAVDQIDYDIWLLNARQNAGH